MSIISYQLSQVVSKGDNLYTFTLFEQLKHFLNLEFKMLFTSDDGLT